MYAPPGERQLAGIPVDSKAEKEGKYVFKDFWWTYVISIDPMTDRVSGLGFFPRRLPQY